MSQCAEPCFVQCPCKPHVHWPDEQGGVLVEIFEYSDGTETPSSTLPLSMDVVVMLLTSTTMVSMSLGYFGHTLSAFFLLVVALPGMLFSPVSASGVKLTGALGLIDDDEDDIEFGRKDLDQFSDAPPVGAATAGTSMDTPGNPHTEVVCKKLMTPSEVRLVAEDKLGAEASEQCVISIDKVESSEEGASLSSFAPTSDVIIVLLTCMSFGSMLLGYTTLLIATISLLAAVAMTLMAQNMLRTTKKNVEGPEEVALMTATCVDVTLDSKHCTMELAFS
mmetsp:Transcript_23145/g.58460  ORF Transcript_23145/g.58460 Transcript_23145/m.58460 type:complete len:278 (-) Transcript_23145:467-1300(-)